MIISRLASSLQYRKTCSMMRIVVTHAVTPPLGRRKPRYRHHAAQGAFVLPLVHPKGAEPVQAPKQRRQTFRSFVG